MAAALSMNSTDSPAAIDVMPVKAAAVAKAAELSSIFQPAMLTAAAPTLVNSNQSLAYGALPLAHGATSVSRTCGYACIDATAASNAAAATAAFFNIFIAVPWLNLRTAVEAAKSSATSMLARVLGDVGHSPDG